MNQNISKSFFLISFLPALAYWYLEANYPIRIALAGGLLLAIVELILEKIFTKHLHALSKFNFFLIIGLGSISLLGDDGIWFKLQPCFTGVIMGGYLLFKTLRGDGLLYEMSVALNNAVPPKEILVQLEKHMAILLLIYGIFMGTVAIWGSTDQWIFFKTAGFYLVFFVFIIVEFLLMKRKIKKMVALRTKQQMFSNL